MSNPHGDGIDFAVAAYREEGIWQVVALPPEQLTDPEAVTSALRRFPGDGGALGLISVDEDFFVAYRVAGPLVRVLVSDGTAAEDWDLAAAALELVDLLPPAADDEPAPAGDLDIFADLGYPAFDLRLLVDDFDLYPDEMLIEIANQLGFGPLFEQATGLSGS